MNISANLFKILGWQKRHQMIKSEKIQAIKIKRAKK